MLSIGAVVATFVAGLASFVAPCTVPLLPAYLACVSGAGAAELADAEHRRSFRGRLLLGSLLYVAGFTCVFVILGLTAGGLARLAQGPGSGRAIEIVGGVIVAVFGLAIVGVVRAGPLERIYSLQLPERLRRRGVAGAFIVGAVFGLGWTPCVGPYLAAALTLAAVSSHAAAGALLLLVYSIGLGMPFVIVALLWASLPELPRRLTRLGSAADTGRWNRHRRTRRPGRHGRVQPRHLVSGAALDTALARCWLRRRWRGPGGGRHGAEPVRCRSAGLGECERRGPSGAPTATASGTSATSQEPLRAEAMAMSAKIEEVTSANAYGTKETLSDGVVFHRLSRLADAGIGDVSRLPMTLKILLENVVRNAGTRFVRDGDVEALARWNGQPPAEDRERPFVPARVLLQDFTGVPAVVDLAAMRAAVARDGGDPLGIDPQVPVDLVVDHSVQVDAFGNAGAYERNIEREYERNRERYVLLRWAQQAFRGFRVVPPGMGIVHQVNLEYLAAVVHLRDIDGERVAIPDTLVGTDSHTPMVNGIGVLGWGVGGIEAEACMLGQPLFLLSPVVVGVRFHNALPAGTTATDLVLTLTEMLRKHGVVNKFVEFCGDGLSSMSVPDRATLSNMSPEFGATASLFPVDEQTLRYLTDTGRDAEQISLVERYCKEQGMFRVDGAEPPVFSEMLELDLATVEPSVAGPKRPQDRVGLSHVWKSFTAVWEQPGGNGNGGGEATAEEERRLIDEGGIDPEAVTETAAPAPEDDAASVRDGSVVIAAITSCTNTSNPAVMVAAGLLARNAVARGLSAARVREDVAGAGLAGCDRLPAARRAPGIAEHTAFQPCRLRMHDLHRKQWSAAGTGG